MMWGIIPGTHHKLELPVIITATTQAAVTLCCDWTHGASDDNSTGRYHHPPPPTFYKEGKEARRTLVQVPITHRWRNQPLDPPKPRLTHPVQAVSLEEICSQSNPNGKGHIRAYSSWWSPPALLLNTLVLSTQLVPTNPGIWFQVTR